VNRSTAFNPGIRSRVYRIYGCRWRVLGDRTELRWARGEIPACYCKEQKVTGASFMTCGDACFLGRDIPPRVSSRTALPKDFEDLMSSKGTLVYYYSPPIENEPTLSR
jgi:hypothetical protein